MIKKMMALFGALAMALGLGLATAGPASAGSGDVQSVEHTTRSPRGLGGNIGVQMDNAPIYTEKNLAEGQVLQYADNQGYGNSVRNVRAGGGYCVWEQLWKANSSHTDLRATFMGDYNYGKSESSNISHTLQSYLRGIQATPAEWLTSDLRVYRC